MADPILFLVDADSEELEQLERVLSRRFGADYRVMSERSQEAALAALERLAEQEEEVALVAADLDPPGQDGVSFLAQARALHPQAVRALFVKMDPGGTRIPFKSLPTVQRAMALGRIDFWTVKGWFAPEELIYPQVQQALTNWTRANRPQHVVIRVVGDLWAPRCHELREILARNTVPYAFYEEDSEEGMRLIGEYGVDPENLPAIITYSGKVLYDTSNIDLAKTLGVLTRPPEGRYDLVIVGGGPSGLAASVLAASEGLRTLVIEPLAIGGQAGTSTMIRNYLGFPWGISGGELAFYAFEQGLLFGAQYVFGQRANALEARGLDRVVTMTDDCEVTARSVIIASGVEYRRLEIPALDRLIGAGVYYSAVGMEAEAMEGEPVFVVGGANSAGQAALHLARFAESVTLVVRGDSLEASMSEYLITQLEALPNVHVRLRTQVVDGSGSDRLETLTLEDGAGQRETVRAYAVFITIGVEPRTAWLPDTLKLDERGYILTGRDVPPQAWKVERSPLPFETCMPGVFSVGDVRFGSVKRIAGAVGEGSVAVGSVHQYLALVDRNG